MANPSNRLLLVESDPVIRDLIGRQALQSLGYQVQLAGDGAEAIAQAVQFQPDALIMNLNLPGLNGKDLLVALAAQGIQVPIIVIARKGMEADIMQAFRLGASDFLMWPVREASVISAVERVLKNVRERHDREQRVCELEEKNEELENRVRELTSISALARATTTAAESQLFYDRISEEAVHMTRSDLGWFMLRKEPGLSFRLQSQYHLPAALAGNMQQPWDDGLSYQAASTGPVMVHGASLKQLPVGRLGQAALAVPVKVKEEVVGSIVVMRIALQPYSHDEQSLLETAVELTAAGLETLSRPQPAAAMPVPVSKGANPDDQIALKLRDLAAGLPAPLQTIQGNLSLLLSEKKGKVTPEQHSLLISTQEKASQIEKLAVAMVSPAANLSQSLVRVNLNDAARQALARFHWTAVHNGITLVSQLASPPVTSLGEASTLSKMIEGLLSNAIRFNHPGGQVWVATARNVEQKPEIAFRDTGPGIDPQRLSSVFDPSTEQMESTIVMPSASYLRLCEIRQIAAAWGGKVWVESQVGQGTTVHLSLPPG